MAEVTGDLGGQPIQLNNAATEATLRQLLAAMTVIANNTGKDKAAQVKTQKELERELKKLADAAKKQATEQDKLTKETEKATEATKKDTDAKKKKADADARAIKAQQEYIAKLTAVQGAMSTLGSSVRDAATGMTGMLSSLANLGNSLTSTAAVFGQIPVVGGVLSSMFGAVAGAAEKTYEAFKKSASVGANFGGSMTEMIDSATGAGLTFDEFSGIIAKTGKDLALLGGDSEAGARRLGVLGKQIKGTTLAADLNRLGYSTEAINEGMATYAGQLAKTGALQGMSDAQLVASTGAYLKDLDALTKLTGKNKSELEGERNARLKDAQFRNIMSKLDVDSQKNLQNLMDSIPAEHQEGMKEIIATGTATSEAGKKALAFLPDSAKNMMSLNQQIRTTGKMGADQANQLNAAYQRETQAFVKSGVAENMALYGDEASKRFFIGASDAAAREKNLAQITAEQQKAASERKAKEEELKSKGLDPASMEAYKNKIAETSNEFTKFLANSGMLDIMMEAFATLVDVVQLVVMPAFEFVAEHFGTIAMVVGGAYAAFLALKGVIFYANLQLAAQTLAATKAALAAGANTVATTGATVAMGKAGIAATIMSLPFIKITLVIGALVGAFLLVRKIFTEMYKAGWDLGTVFEAIGDNLKGFMLILQEGFLNLLDKLTFGDANKKIKEALKGVEVDRQALKEKEKARDAQREANKSARAAEKAKEELETVAGRKAARAKEKEAEASDAVSKAKKQEAEAAKDKTASTSTPGVNLSSPQAMYDSMVRRQKGETAGATNQPGATAVNKDTPASGSSAGAQPSSPGAQPSSPDMKKYLQSIALIESGGNANAKAGTSSASGMFQFTEGTWKQMAKEMGKEYSLNDRFDPQKATEVAAYFSSKQQKQLEKGVGRETNNTDMYMSHFLGAGGATKFLKAKDQNANQSAAALDPKAAAANKNIYYNKEGKERSVQEVYDLMDKKVKGAESAVTSGKWGGKALSGDVAAIGGANLPTLASAKIPAGKLPSGVDQNMALYGTEEQKKQALDAMQAGKQLTKAQAEKDRLYAQTMASMPSNIPTTAAVQTAVTPTPVAGATTQQAEAARQIAEAARREAATTDPRRSDRAQTAVAGARQETPESLLASLNTKMDQLIAINRSLKDTNERQLSVQKGIAQGGDLYAAA